MTEISRRGFIKGAAALAPLAVTPLRLPQQGAANEHFDFVVAGAGHNSLVCAAYLAKAGFKVLVLEGRPTIGGGCKTQEVCLPGFKEDLCSSVHGAIRNNPLIRNNELNLRDYGYGEYIESDPVMHIPFLDGSSISVWRDLDHTCEEIGRISKKDAQTFRALTAEYRAYEAAVEAGKRPNSPRWRQRLAMSGYDLVCELFESDHVRAATLGCGHFGGESGGDLGTGNQAFSLITQVLHGRAVPKGGSGTLSVSLGRFIEAHNGVVLTNKPVVQVIIEGGKCTGVECADGSQYRAGKAVVSTIHVKHLINMAPRELWGQDFLDQVELFQPEHAMFQFHYATTEPPKYPLATGGTISTCEAVLLQSPERVLRLTYDNDRGDVNLEDPLLQIVSPSVTDPTRAPAGYHTVKIEGTLPYELKQGPEHWDNIKEEVAAKIFAYLGKFAPNLTTDKVLAKFLESPIDIERMNPAMWHGSAHHGDRRLPQFASYKLPIPSLYQTGACTPPGGSISGMPGRNAAAAILKDNGMTIEQVVAKAT